MKENSGVGQLRREMISAVASSLSLLSSSHKKFSINLNSYPNTNQRCSIVYSGVRTARVMAMRQRQSRDVSATEARVSLVLALASQASSVSQRRKCSVFRNLHVLLSPQILYLNYFFFFLVLSVIADLAVETAKYVFPKRFNSSNLEEALMSG